MSTMLEQRFLTVQEAAQRLGVNDSRVRQLLRAGRLKGEKVGTWMWLIPEPEVDRLASEERRPGRPPKNGR